MIHSKVGWEIFNSIKGQLKYKVISCQEAVEGVKEMLISPQVNDKRAEFFKDYKNMQMEDLVEKYFSETMIVKTKKYIRRILNWYGLDKTLKHILKRR